MAKQLTKLLFFSFFISLSVYNNSFRVYSFHITVYGAQNFAGESLQNDSVICSKQKDKTANTDKKYFRNLMQLAEGQE